MATGSVLAYWPRGAAAGVAPPPPRPTTSTAANTAAALAPTQASGPLGSSFGLGLPGGYAAALTQYLDPAAMDAQINADAYGLAGHTAADQGWGEGDGRKSRLAGEIAAPALQAYRMNLLNQVPQFWQMEQQQKAAEDARADRQRELAWERQQHTWETQDREDARRYQTQVRNDARRDAQSYRNSGYAAATTSSGLPGGFPGAGVPGTGSISGGPAVSNSTFGQSNLLSHSRPQSQPSYSASNYETAADAAARQAGNPRSSSYTGPTSAGSGGGSFSSGSGHEAPHSAGFDFSGSKNTGGFQVQGLPTSGPLTSSLKNATNWANNYK